MANFEGPARMRKVGKVLVLCGMVFMVLGAGLYAYAWHAPRNYGPVLMFPSLALLFYLGFFPEIVGGILWVTGWIVEGFLAQRSPGSDATSHD